MGVINTLATRALRISDEKSLDNEKANLPNFFANNGYSKHLGQKAFLKANKNSLVKKDPKERVSRLHLPFIQGITYNISRILRKHNVPSTFRPLNIIRSSLISVKYPVDPKDMKGVYVIPHSCGTPYVGETSHSINQRINEHSTNIKHGRTRSSALAEHAENTKHNVCIEEARVISKVAHFHHQKFREAIEIEKRMSKLNKDDGWKISSGWIPTLSS